MPTLNEGLTWQAVCADRTTFGWGDTVKNAFLDDDKEGGHAQPVLVPEGTALYKFTQSANHEQNGLKDPKYGSITPWWSPTQPFGKFDVGLAGVLKFAKTVGVTATEYVRLIAAINPDWGNALDMILQAKLRTDVWGIWGQAANQDKGKTGVHLVGRVYQLWIPKLTDANISFVSKDTPENVAAALV
jgi:hypothetical protein